MSRGLAEVFSLERGLSVPVDFQEIDQMIRDRS